MTIKFGRNYRVTIDPRDGGESIVVGMPFTCQFAMQRNTQSSLNYLNLQLYNLSARNRNRIFQDRYTPGRKQIRFEAGYGKSLSLIFQGDIFEANSTRESSNIITTIEAKEGTFDVTQTMTFKTLQPTNGALSVESIIRSLIGDFPTLKPGAISPRWPSVSRPVVLSGNTYDLLKEYTEGHVFVDLNKVNVFKDDEVISGNVPLISSATGLLGTPQRDDAFLTVNTLLEPRIQIGFLAELQSSVMPQYNGQYKVLGLQHQGTISEAVAGDCRSTFNLATYSRVIQGFKDVKAT